MSKVKDTCINNCPEFLMHDVIRKRIKINYNLPQDFQFLIADNQTDIHRSLNMIYKSYLKVGKIKPNPLEIHTVEQNLLDKTEMIICKNQNTVIGSVSLVKREKNGLPCEKVYDLSKVYATQKNVYELSCLATAHEFRKQSKDILFPLFKFAYNYMVHKGDPDAVWVILANPKFVPLYKGIFGFEFLSDGREIRTCASSNNFPVNGLYLDLCRARKFMARHYGHRPAERNLHYFYTEFDMPNFILPARSHNLMEKSILEREVGDIRLHLRGLIPGSDLLSEGVPA